MKPILRVVALMLFAAAAQAASDQVLVSQDGVARLLDKPCENESILERVMPIHRTELRAGSLTLDGKVIEACWVAGKDMVFMIDTDGDLSRIPLSDFR